MCGFVGLLSRDVSKEILRSRLHLAADSLAHRGPDDSSMWFDRDVGLGLAHRRLAIIDPSPEGRQPMVSASGRFLIIYNGEIYNFPALGKELQKRGVELRSNCDTEVLLEGCEHLGLSSCLQQANGMFAFALWDRRERVLHLARDRVGVKPLYYGWLNGGFYFGSELRVFPLLHGENCVLSEEGKALFLRYGYIPAPFSAYRGIFKLLPGSVLSLPLRYLEESPQDFSPSEGRWVERFWKIPRAGLQKPIEMGVDERLAELENLLSEAVQLRMRADVPLGAFLSGGIDSSLVVALMQQKASRPVKTFTIGFREDEFNEAPAARSIAQYLGTDHTEEYLDSAAALEILPQLPAIYDEPFADFSSIPTILVSRLARSEVGVSLSGDGGDELFGGYLPKYQKAHRLAQLLNSIALANDFSGGSLLPLLERISQGSFASHRLRKATRYLKQPSEKELYRQLLTKWEPAELLEVDRDVEPLLSDGFFGRSGSSAESLLEEMFAFDFHYFLPDDLLVKLDRASMAFGLEAREPLLDFRLVEWAARLPAGEKVARGKGKVMLRALAQKHLPREIASLPKRGFSLPLKDWLRGSLRGWAEDLLQRHKLQDAGLLPAPILKSWSDHLSGRKNWEYPLWTILSFQTWLASQQKPQ